LSRHCGRPNNNWCSTGWGNQSNAQSLATNTPSTTALTLQIERVEFFVQAGRERPERDVFFVVVGTLVNGTQRERCARARDARLILDDTEYSPQNGVMDELKPILDRDFLGAYQGQCVPEGESRDTFMAFDVPLATDESGQAVLRFLDERLTLTFESPGMFFAQATSTSQGTPAQVQSANPVVAATNTRGANALGASAQNARQTATAISAALATTYSQATNPPPAATLAQPTLPPVVQATTSADPVVYYQQPRTYYAQSGGSNYRDAPSRQGTVIGQIAAGGAIVVIGEIVGEAVNAGNPIWYVADFNGSRIYLYSAVVTSTAPAPAVAPVQQPPAVQQPPVMVQPAQPAAPRPGNCSTAVAMGLDARQAAAAGLDRDGDGVACYGD
jgi:hypothetical protein